MIESNKQLNKMLSAHATLAKEALIFPNNTPLINMLIELVNENYIFNQQQFNNFIKQICVSSNGNDCFIQSLREEHQTIIKYMLIHYTLTEVQFIKICDTLLLRNCNCPTYWIDILFFQKYNFTIMGYDYLNRLNYKYVPMQYYLELHNNTIYSACLHIMASSNNKKFKYCLKLIEDNKKPFDIEHFKIILCCLSRHKNIKNKHDELKLLLDALFINVNDATEIFDQIIEHQITSLYALYTTLLMYIVNRFVCNDVFIKYLCDNVVPQYPEYLMMLMREGNFRPDVNVLNGIIDKNSCEWFFVNNKEDYEKLDISTQLLVDGKFGSCSKIKMLDLYDLFKVEPTITSLNIICKKYSIEEIDMMIDKYKLIPEKETLDICITTLNFDLINKILNYKVIPDDKTFYKLNDCEFLDCGCVKIIELLVSHGLWIQYEHIEFLLSHGFGLSNLERFDIKYDERLYFTCYLYNFWPEEYKIKFTIDKNVLGMHYLCINKKLTYEKLIKYLKTYDLKLDYYAIDFLFFNNSHICDYVMEKFKCIPFILTTYKCCDLPVVGWEKTIIDRYGIGYQDMLNPYEMNV